MPRTSSSLSLREARRLALVAQGLVQHRANSAPIEVLRRVGAVQLDTISVLARSHLLVHWSRLGAMDSALIEGALWSEQSPTTFEYWSHAMCVLPIERWPWYAFKRRERLAKGRRWHRLKDGEKSLEVVRERLRQDGPLTANQLGGAKSGGVWWDWTEDKIAVEWLLDIGEVACVKRKGFARVYDLAERVVPAELLEASLDDGECHRLLIAAAGRSLGVASVDELAAYSGHSTAQVRAHVADTDLLEVQIEGLKNKHYAHPELLARLGERVRWRTTLLSPFDSLVWYRPRAERLFSFVQRLEAYVPKEKRVHGYFAMPILAGQRLVGRIDPKRDGKTLVARHVSLLDKSAVDGAAGALVEAARWVRADSIAIERVSPLELEPQMKAALSSASLNEGGWRRD